MPLTWEKLSQLTSKVPSRTLSIWAAPLWLAENKCCCLQQRGSCSLNFRLLNHSFICSFDKFLLRAYYVFTAFPVTGDRIREKIGQKNKKPCPQGVSVLEVWARAGISWSKWGARVQNLRKYPLSGSTSPWLEDSAPSRPQLDMVRHHFGGHGFCSWASALQSWVGTPRISTIPEFSRWVHVQHDWEPLHYRPRPRNL